MTNASHPTEIYLKDLTELKERAESFLLPPHGKKSVTGVGNTFSPFKSRGLDFQEVRVYQPGDDIRQIDWHVTAKYGKPFTKLYTEEKERTIFFVVDLRANMRFATKGDFKSVMAARMAAFMAFIAAHQKDKIGFILLTDDGIIPYTGADKEALSFFLETMVHPQKRPAIAGDWQKALQMLGQFLPAGSYVFLFSDFYDWNKEETRLLAPLSSKNTFLFCALYDELEANLPNDTLPFSDGENILVVRTQSDKIRQKFHTQWATHQEKMQADLAKYDWGFLMLSTDSDYLTLLTRFCFGEK